jgi:hypothetical protein
MAFGHHARDLRNVAKVVDNPRREKLTKRDWPKLGVLARQIELIVRQLPRTQGFQITNAQTLKVVNELRERPASTLAKLSETVEGRKGATVTLVQNDLRARNPVGPFGNDEMTNDVEGTPGLRSLCRVQPLGWEARQHRAECEGRSLEHRDR